MKKRHFNFLMIIVLCLCIVLSIFLFKGRAWFFFPKERKVDTNAYEVEDPPLLYILDSDASDITQLSLSGLQLGQTQRIVFCISSVYPVTNDTFGYDGLFSLELSYTTNLQATYSLYQANIESEASRDTISYYSQGGTKAYFSIGDKLVSSDVSDNGNTLAYGNDYSGVQLNNQAKYEKYTFSSDETAPNNNLQFIDNGASGLFNTQKCRFFVLEITWDKAQNIDPKETDMIYISARGGNQDE